MDFFLKGYKKEGAGQKPAPSDHLDFDKGSANSALTLSSVFVSA